jgi:hypothetical protein
MSWPKHQKAGRNLPQAADIHRKIIVFDGGKEYQLYHDGQYDQCQQQGNRSWYNFFPSHSF